MNHQGLLHVGSYANLCVGGLWIWRTVRHFRWNLGRLVLQNLHRWWWSDWNTESFTVPIGSTGILSIKAVRLIKVWCLQMKAKHGVHHFRAIRCEWCQGWQPKSFGGYIGSQYGCIGHLKKGNLKYNHEGGGQDLDIIGYCSEMLDTMP